MSWVDLIVIALALLAAISGWRHGVAVALLSFVGVLGGAIIGVRVAPLLAQDINNTNTRVIVSVAVVVILVVLGETTGVFLGRRVRDRITGEHFLAVDSTLGSILQALAVVVAAWLVALPLASASLPGIAAGVRGRRTPRSCTAPRWPRCNRASSRSAVRRRRASASSKARASSSRQSSS